MSLEYLLQAAEFLDRREREAEHGYASSMPVIPSKEIIPTRGRRNSSGKTKKGQTTNFRTTHNELEKNRRAHLRSCLEKLKDLVPVGNEGTRHTTLGLLMKAKCYIKSLEDKDRRYRYQRDQLQRKNRRLADQMRGAVHSSKRRSVSESSAFSSASSSGSVVTTSFTGEEDDLESDEVDILGYQSGSCQSTDDLDDGSSIESQTSDGGITIISSRRGV